MSAPKVQESTSNKPFNSGLEALASAVTTQDISPDNIPQNPENSEEMLAKLKEGLSLAETKYAELKEKHETQNKTLEDLGEISPRELAAYVSEPFDLLLANQNADKYEAFEAFFRDEEKSSESINHETLITQYFAEQQGKAPHLLEKVDCRLKECKLFLFAPDAHAFMDARLDMHQQSWASDLTANGFRVQVDDIDGQARIAYMFSYLLPESSGGD